MKETERLCFIGKIVIFNKISLLAKSGHFTQNIGFSLKKLYPLYIGYRPETYFKLKWKIEIS